MRDLCWSRFLFVLGVLLIVSGTFLKCRIDRQRADTRAVVEYALDAAVVEYRPEGGTE